MQLTGGHFSMVELHHDIWVGGAPITYSATVARQPTSVTKQRFMLSLTKFYSFQNYYSHN